MSLAIRIAKNCMPTAKLLAELLHERGVQTTLGASSKAKAVLSWGVPLSPAKNVLNSHAGGADKLAQLQTLARAGLRTVPFIPRAQALETGCRGMWNACLARKRHHRGGTDIRFCRTPRRAALMLQRGWDFLSPVVASKTEFRVWVYRGAHLGTYEKVLVRPGDQFNRHGKRRFGRNYRNGYAFQLVKSANLNAEAIELARRTLDALKLDFAAVDILLGTDGRCYVLESNSAPGVEGEGRQVIRSLADKVANWYKRDCPERKKDA